MSSAAPGDPVGAAAGPRRLVERWCDLTLADVEELCADAVRYSWVSLGLLAEGRAAVHRLVLGTRGWRTRSLTEHVAVTGPFVMLARTVFFDDVAARQPSFAVPTVGAFTLDDDGRVLEWTDYFDLAHYRAASPLRAARGGRTRPG